MCQIVFVGVRLVAWCQTGSLLVSDLFFGVRLVFFGVRLVRFGLFGFRRGPKL